MNIPLFFKLMKHTFASDSWNYFHPLKCCKFSVSFVTLAWKHILQNISVEKMCAVCSTLLLWTIIMVICQKERLLCAATRALHASLNLAQVMFLGLKCKQWGRAHCSFNSDDLNSIALDMNLTYSCEAFPSNLLMLKCLLIVKMPGYHYNTSMLFITYPLIT